MNYWLVRAKWGVENKKADFINNDEWINGYDDKYLEIVKRVETEDILLLAEDSTVTHYGKCIDNPQDGKHLTVDKWGILQEPISFPAKGSYVKAIVKVNDEDLINTARVAIENTIENNDIKVNSITIENFTVFKNQHLLEFSEGLNIVIGENGTGKSHLLKLIYSVMISINEMYYTFYPYEYESDDAKDVIQVFFDERLVEVFKPEKLNNLITHKKENCFINVILNDYLIKFELSDDIISIDEDAFYLGFFKKRTVFIPAKEILSFYEGFLSLLESRETSFDETYHNLAKAVGLPALKNMDSYPVENKLLFKLEEILDGKILLERGRFYLVSHKTKQKIEITLIAEGLRKIGMIAQLLANGSLTKNSILFWDEPETNLNPRLIKKIAEVLVELNRAGMQIFIATHSLFLVKEIEILRNKQDKVKYFGLGFNEKNEIRVSQSEEFEYLEDIVLLDEELDQDDRFLAKEEG